MGTFKFKHNLNTKLAGELYQKGMSDKEIAENCGVSTTTVRNWRKRAGLVANYGKKKERYLTPLEKDAIAARKAGLSYGQYKAKFFRG